MSYNLLKGKRGIIFGALNEQSIAWKITSCILAPRSCLMRCSPSTHRTGDNGYFTCNTELFVHNLLI